MKIISREIIKKNKKKKIMQKQNPSKSSKKIGMKLFWVTDDDDCENCFIIAKTVRGAKTYYADSEGMDEEELTAQRIIDVPEKLYEKYYSEEKGKATYAHTPILLDLGFKMISEGFPEIFEFKGRKFGQGGLGYYYDDKSVRENILQNLVDKAEKTPMESLPKESSEKSTEK